MRSLLLAIAITGAVFTSVRAEERSEIDANVVQIQLPPEDVTLYYLEMKGGMAIELRTESSSIIGKKFYVGDGVVATELVAHNTRGIMFQKKTELHQGFVFKKNSTVIVLPEYKHASELQPGDVYVILPNVDFKLPRK